MLPERAGRSLPQGHLDQLRHVQGRGQAGDICLDVPSPGEPEIQVGLLRPGPQIPNPTPQRQNTHSLIGCSQLLYRNMQRFRGGLVFKAHRLV